ncbi:hypothetical protein [Stenotrophomonas maltophilia]|uniref:hypothetical protein n=1 Tax=Stenotrophomonas maltophilia TaxID=40324 RepID=UPI002091172A|nr:hypothetical protein [Stenotrophomonas maltophilia]MCO5735949.1 hypothetical protein [Stenotrophomonas maltophilia]
MTTTLSEGSRKVLLIDPEAIARNAERGAGNVQPVVAVAEVDDAGSVLSLTRGLTVEIRGTVDFEYSQHAFLFVIDRVPMRGAFVTTAEVVIDGGEESAPAAAAPPSKPTRPARKAVTKPEEATA